MTSSRSVLAVAACAAMTLALLPGAAPASAAPGGTGGARTSASQAASPSGTVSDLTLSTSAVTVDGFAVAPVMVEFTLTGGPVDATGVVLLRTTTTWDVNAPRHLPARVTRVDGTVGNGTYRGTLQVPSTAHGGWRVSSVGFGNDGGYPQDPTPAIDLREQGLPDVLLDVSGTHRPRFRFDRTVPKYPSTTVTLRGTLTDSDTGRPLKGRRVSFGIDSQCTEDGLAGTRTTGASGRATYTERLDRPRMLCAWAPLPGSTRQGQSYARSDNGTWATFGLGLTVTVTTPTVRVGRSTTVKGSLLTPYPSAIPGRSETAGHIVRLQRLVGRTWRTVNSAQVRITGRYTLTATPPRRGRHAYRVWFPSPDVRGGRASRVLWITAR